jgi:hypothetical protein
VRKWRDHAMELRTRVHDMIGQKKTRADVEKLLRAEFDYEDLHVQRSLDGLMLELQ